MPAKVDFSEAGATPENTLLAPVTGTTWSPICFRAMIRLPTLHVGGAINPRTIYMEIRGKLQNSFYQIWRAEMKFSSYLLPIITTILFIAGSGSVLAHHSTAIYDSDNPVDLHGRVVEWQFTNPHTFIILAVSDENGGETVWSLEGGNTSIMFRRGWTPESLRPGDEIIVTARPLHSGAPGGNFSDVRNPDGTPFDPRMKR